METDDNKVYIARNIYKTPYDDKFIDNHNKKRIERMVMKHARKN